MYQPILFYAPLFTQNADFQKRYYVSITANKTLTRLALLFNHLHMEGFLLPKDVITEKIPNLLGRLH